MDSTKDNGRKGRPVERTSDGFKPFTIEDFPRIGKFETSDFKPMTLQEMVAMREKDRVRKA